MKRKVFLSPLIIIILIIVFGIGAAGAAIFFGGEGRQGDVSPGKGLVGQWKMDGNANDSTPNKNNGTVTGATLTTDRKEEVNKAYQFNGTTDNIEVPDASNLDPTGSVSVEAWVYSP